MYLIVSLEQSEGIIFWKKVYGRQHTYIIKTQHVYKILHLHVRKVWRNQTGNQKPWIIEWWTTQWPKGNTTIYKTLHRKLMMKQHEPH